MLSPLPDPARPAWQHLTPRLLAQLQHWLPDVDEPMLHQVASRLERVALPAGETLMRQGEPGDSLYLLVAGRLRVYVTERGAAAGDAPAERRIRDLARGQIVGEMSLITGEPRSATVVAVRDSVLARLDLAGFDALQAASPALSKAITRQIIQRLRTERGAVPGDRPAIMAVVPVTAGVDAAGFARSLAARLAEHGRTATVGRPAPEATASPERLQRLHERLDETEAEHDFVLLAADDAPTPWTEACLRHADEILLLADPREPVALHPTESTWLAHRSGRAEATEVLVLLHPAGTEHPTGTARWLARRPVSEVVHLRAGRDADLARLARLQARRAVGLVLAGGGARGFAHLGVAQALAEAGVEIDVLGGTSIGAAMATLLATGRPIDELADVARRGFGRNPTSDFSLTPVLSFIKGDRLRGIVSNATAAIAGPGAQLEDLWKGCFCVITNFSQASEQVRRRGDLATSVIASAAIPGALPPVLDGGELLVDGGTFNNFPVDVMRRTRGVGTVIGVDLSLPRGRRVALEALPSNLQVFLDRLRPKRLRRYRLPTMATMMMNVNIMYSMSRQAESHALADLVFTPPIAKVGMLDWKKFDVVRAQGLEHGREVLARTDLASLGAGRGPRAAAAAAAAGGTAAPAPAADGEPQSSSASASISTL